MFIVLGERSPASSYEWHFDFTIFHPSREQKSLTAALAAAGTISAAPCALSLSLLPHGKRIAGIVIAWGRETSGSLFTVTRRAALAAYHKPSKKQASADGGI